MKIRIKAEHGHSGNMAATIAIPLGWAAIRHDFLGAKDRRANHGKWVRLQTANGTIYRQLRLSLQPKRDVIGIDWLGWLELTGRADNY